MNKKNLVSLTIAFVLLASSSLNAVALTRDEALVRAQTYCFHPWSAANENLTASCLGSYQSVYVPGDYLGLPYDWGGYVTLFQFDDGIYDGKGAGSYPEHGVLSCTVGLDCSGYVSKIWDVGHFGTATIHNVSHEISAGEVLPGDAFNVPSYHVALFAGELSDGWPVFYEAIGYNTMYNTFAGWANVSGFTPIRLDTISGSAGSTPSGTAGNPIEVTTFPYVHNGNTSNSKSDLFDYYGADTSKKESGPEVIYAVEIDSPGKLTISVQDGAGVDIDVHLCSALETYHCVARHDSLIEMDISKCGTWYVVADTWCNASGSEFPGAYTLTLEFSPKGGQCGTNQPFDFAGGIGDPCGYPGNSTLPFCNLNLGAVTCLYSNADDYSFCTYPCAKDSECQNHFPGGCCIDVAGSGDAADFFCVVDDFCQPVQPPVDEGSDDPADDVVVQPPADVVTSQDVPVWDPDGTAVVDGVAPIDGGESPDSKGSQSDGESLLPGEDGAHVGPSDEVLATNDFGRAPASDDQLGGSDGGSSCSAAQQSAGGGIGIGVLLLGMVLLMGVRRWSVRGVAWTMLLLTFSLAACGGKSSPEVDITTDGTVDGAQLDGGIPDGQVDGEIFVRPDEDVPKTDTIKPVDGDAMVVEESGCVPSCAGKECGADGCGGSCGECPGADTTCNDVGLCTYFSCESSKDCPGDLICFKEEGFCVECAVSADCADNQKCTAEYLCIDVVACISDKDCKEVDGVCDKEAGECVDCLSDLDCPDEWLCVEKICFEPVCQLNEARCNGQIVEVCNATLTGWDLVKTCPETQFCVAGKCLDHVCQPNAKFCDDQTATVCNADGSGPAESTDCAAIDLFCSAGECTECQPQCDGKECGDDGCGGNCGVCPEGVPCKEDGNQYICGTACDLAASEGRSLGCEFWAVDLDNVEGGQFSPVALFVAVPPGNGEAKLLVERFENGAPIALTPAELDATTLTIEPGAVATLIMPQGIDVNGSELSSKAIRLGSTVPITVHQFNPLNTGNLFTNDASLLLPSHLGGKEYLTLSWPQRTEGYSLRGNITVVATGLGDTFLQIWPTSPVQSGSGVPSMAPNPPEPYETAMKQGEVLNLATDGTQGSDLTGTRVLSSQAIAVFGGHECANVPLGTNYCDHIEQQLLPVENLDKLYAGDAFAPRNLNQKDVWRVVAVKDDTAVALVPPVAGPFKLEKGQWVEFYSGAAFILEATEPVTVGHYLQGSNYPGFAAHQSCTGGTGIGDPAFTIALPLKNFRYTHHVLTPDTYQEDFINIVAPSGPLVEVTLDGLQLAEPFVPIGTSGYGLAQVPVSDGLHEVKSEGGPVGVTSYGYACDVSYAYPGGL